jgi:hypothetical protein
MFKKLFGNGDEKPKKMTKKEAWEIVERDWELTWENTNKDSSLDKIEPTSEDKLTNEVSAITYSFEELDKFNSAGELMKVLDAMRLRVEKIIDSSDVEQVEYNKKVREALDILSSASNVKFLYWYNGSALGGLAGLAIGLTAMVTSDQSFEDKIKLINLGIPGGAAVGALVSETARRKNYKNKSSQWAAENILDIRNGVMKELSLPKSLATEVNQHIERVEYEEIFEKLDDSEKL